MSKLLFVYSCLLWFCQISSCLAGDTTEIPVNRIYYTADQNLSSMVSKIGNFNLYPRTLNDDGSVKFVSASDWTSGFFPGTLWYMFEKTGNIFYKNNAVNWTSGIASQKDNTSTHDLGFMLYCSFGNGLRISNPDSYAEVLLTAANSLMTRFNSTVGCMRSWDFGSWGFPVIIDNMLNLELLFWATQYSGDSSYFKAAVQHAETTIENHYRDDYSSFHLVDYNEASGEVVSKQTVQGYSNSSHWARGQAWGLYGYVMCYRETENPEFLEQAENIADFYIKHPKMPEDLIPYWDFMAPDIPNEPRDASAAAIAASALLELSTYSLKGEQYFNFAKQSLLSLSGPDYLSEIHSNGNFILLKSTGHKPANREISVPVNWADYYFIEAMNRYSSISDKNFEPYIHSSEYCAIPVNEISRDTLIIYDLDSEALFDVIIENNPGFLRIEEIDSITYEIIAEPGEADAGTYSFAIAVTDTDDNSVRIDKTYYVEMGDLEAISAYSSFSTNNNWPEFTIDRNFNTYWESVEYGGWIMYDLGKEYLLDTVRIAFDRGNRRSYSFIIQVSINGSDWETKLFAESSGNSIGFESFGFSESAVARYVKIIGYGNTVNTENRYSEVRFNISDYTTSSISDDIAKKIAFQKNKNFITISGSGSFMLNKIQIYNINGSLVDIIENDLDGADVYVPICNYREGVYFIVISLGDEKFTHLFIKN